ncbi:MAG: response regulator [Bacteroidetes bacterium]|nr:response regulator [Bacteroidota bacterium]
MKATSLAIVEDDLIVRESLQTLFGENPQFELQAVHGNVEDFLKALETTPQIQPNILLLDIQLPGMSGIAGIPHIKRLRPSTNIVMLTTFEDSESIFAALCAGACSYLSKQTSLVNIRDAVITVSRGGSYMSPSVARKVVEHFSPKPKKESAHLTDRQLDIVRCIVDGLSYKMIADRLDISIDTVRTHIMHVYRALNINSKGELIRKSLEGEV